MPKRCYKHSCRLAGAQCYKEAIFSTVSCTVCVIVLRVFYYLKQNTVHQIQSIIRLRALMVDRMVRKFQVLYPGGACFYFLCGTPASLRFFVVFAVHPADVAVVP